MIRRPFMSGGTALLAIGGMIGAGIGSFSGPALAVQAETGFKDDLLPIFTGHYFGCHEPRC